MAKLKNYNGRYCESEYESAFIAFLESVGWHYLAGNQIPRSYSEVLIAGDFKAFIAKTSPNLLPEEIEQLYDTARLAGAESDFATLHKVYKWMVDGIQFSPQNGLRIMVPRIANATIYDAWEQITIRYWRDIPQLLHYCPLACISDGVKTRLGTVRTPYEHFYAWRRVNDGDKLATMPFE